MSFRAMRSTMKAQYVAEAANGVDHTRTICASSLRRRRLTSRTTAVLAAMCRSGGRCLVLLYAAGEHCFAGRLPVEVWLADTVDLGAAADAIVISATAGWSRYRGGRLVLEATVCVS